MDFVHGNGQEAAGLRPGWGRDVGWSQRTARLAPRPSLLRAWEGETPDILSQRLGWRLAHRPFSLAYRIQDTAQPGQLPISLPVPLGKGQLVWPSSHMEPLNQRLGASRLSRRDDIATNRACVGEPLFQLLSIRFGNSLFQLLQITIESRQYF